MFKIKIQGEKLFFENFPFKTKEVGISFINSGVTIYDEPIKNLENWQMNVKVEDGVCVDQKAADMMLGYFNGITEMSFTQTPTGSYICRTKSTTQIDQLN